jgi:uncharacterized RDD family membrane protein YckC
MASEGLQFDADTARAPFTLRCGAILIDYILLAGILVVSSLIARGLGGGARLAGSPLNTAGLLIAVGATAFNFLVLPWTRGRTMGKWATGLRIVTKDGEPIGLVAVLLRHVIGYPVSTIPFCAGFLVAVFNQRGRALHDLIARTMVVSGH